MDSEFGVLALLSIIMLCGSYGAGCIPLIMPMSEVMHYIKY